MKKNILTLAMMSSMLIFTSCDSNENNDTTSEEVKVVENCIYSYNEANTELNWTAYKFLSKAGVGGTFKTINVEGELSGSNPKTIIESINFNIPINSVETQDESRNKKIQTFFFGSLENTDLLSGEIVSLNDDGMAVFKIKMNNVEKEIKGEYTLNDNHFKFATAINVNDWNASVGIDALNEECKDLHTDFENGDTESKLWPDVDILLDMKLTKNCD